MKKVIILSLVLLMTLATITDVYAASKFEFTLKASKSEASKNDEITVEGNISKIGFEKGIVALGGTLEYDKNSLEFVRFEAGENWAKPSYYENSKKFATDRSGYGKDDETVFKIIFKVKDGAKDDVTIKLSEVSGSDGEDEVTLENITTKITIKNETSKPDDQNPGDQNSDDQKPGDQNPDDQKQDDQKPNTNTSKDNTNTNTNKNNNNNTNTNKDNNTNANTNTNTNTNTNNNTNTNKNTNKINSSKNTNVVNNAENLKGGILPKAGTTSVLFATVGIMLIVAAVFYAKIKILDKKSRH